MSVGMFFAFLLLSTFPVVIMPFMLYLEYGVPRWIQRMHRISGVVAISCGIVMLIVRHMGNHDRYTTILLGGVAMLSFLSGIAQLRYRPDEDEYNDA